MGFKTHAIPSALFLIISSGNDLISISANNKYAVEQTGHIYHATLAEGKLDAFWGQKPQAAALKVY